MKIIIMRSCTIAAKNVFFFFKSLHVVLENLANLLRVDIYQLMDALTQKSMILRGEEILSPLSVEQVCACIITNL